MVIKNRRLFRLTRLVLLKLPLLFSFFAKLRKPQKKLLIIKTDAIGDYILFRNFLEVTKLSDTYKDYKIDVLGNVLWKDIALTYDSRFVDEFIFIKADLLYEMPLRTLTLGWRLFKNNYDTVLQPTYSRTFINDGLARLTAAKQIIGFESDNERIAERYKIKTDRFYTRRLALPRDAYFEFERSKFFFESVLNQKLLINETSIVTTSLTKQGIVIVPGAGILKRCWEAKKFLELIRMILKHTAHTVYLEGGPSAFAFADYLPEEIAAKRVVDLTGKTTLPEMITLISSAVLLIANETSAIHIAVAAKTPSVCIMGGGHFERFSPYPEYFKSRPVCVYQKMECYYCNWNCIYKVAENEPYPCVGNVGVDMVWYAVQPLIRQ